MIGHPLVGCLLLLVALTLYKGSVLYRAQSYERNLRFLLVVLGNEARFWAYLCLLAALSLLTSSVVLGLALRLGVALPLLLALLDIGIFLNFSQRLTLADLYTFTFKLNPTYTFAVIKTLVRHLGLWSYTYLLLIVAFVLLLVWLLTYPVAANYALAGWLCGAALLLAAFSASIAARTSVTAATASVATATTPPPVAYTHSAAINVIDLLRLNATRNRPYSRAFAQAFLARYNEPPAVCVQGLGVTPRPNLILIILESFSMCHSKHLSGIFNFTPNLDMLMRENVVFTNFYANGGTSTDALVALLGGTVPLPSPRYAREPTLNVYDHFDETLPRLMGRHGYQTLFMTAADVAAFGVGAWASTIGFASVQARADLQHDQSRAQGFSTATDETLYQNAILHLQRLQSPYLMVLETGSSHEPFIDPDTMRASEGLCMRYADRKIYEFIRYLEATNFFANGMVMIVSDHRRRGAVLPQEYARYGAAAPFQIPMIIIDGKKEPRTVTAPYQQTDILTSWRYLLETGPINLSPLQGILLPEPSHSANVILSRNVFDVYDSVNVVQHGMVQRVRLAGDATRFEDPQVGRNDLLDMIHYQRLRYAGVKG
ncbi:LTA synthase family protein [Candidatus Viridilinea mediisalina]|nr:LTA synthase family protein [Candidatus Viridilinea mediisalina]